MKIVNCVQGSGEWKAARCGLVTASEVDALVTPTFKLREGVGVETYLYKKLAEKFLGYAEESGSTYQMDQGSLAEKIALPWFNFTYNCEAQPVGFCATDDGRCGASPDALIGDDSGLELKFPSAPVHLKYLLKNELPAIYAPQVHFSMFVTGRPRWVFCSFSRQFTPLVIHVERDEKIQAAIRAAVAAFYDQFEPLYAKLCAQRDLENAAKQAAYEKSL